MSAATGVPWLVVAGIGMGAAAGALCRYLAGLWFNALWHGFPLGTLIVNAIGGLLIGMAMVAFDRQPNDLLRLTLVTGFLGGLTTFSAFSAESLNLIQRGDWALAAMHTAAHVIGAVLCASAGFQLMTRLWPAP